MNANPTDHFEGPRRGEIRDFPQVQRAWVSETAGGPDSLVLRDIARPEPGPGQVRVRVQACGLNYPDVLLVADRYDVRLPRPFVPGMELAGTIDALGAGAHGFSIGDRVAAYLESGGLAQYALTNVSSVMRVPEVISLDIAASVLVTYSTAYHALVDRGTLQAGERLLVLGASGGVGLAAIALGKALGAHVIAGTSSDVKSRVARQQGADDVFVYPERVDDPRALARQIKDVCGAGSDVVFDPVGGEYTEAAFRAISWNGRHLVVGFVAGIPRVPLNLPLLKGAQLVGVNAGSFSERYPARFAANISRVFELIASGRVRPLAPTLVPFENARDGLADLAGRKVVGKLVVRVAEA